MSEKLELEIKKRAIALQRAIEKVTGESYEDLTEAVKGALERTTSEELLYEYTGRMTTHAYMFENQTEEFKLPRINFINSTSIRKICNNSGVTEVGFYINCPNCTDIWESFKTTPNLKRMVGINTSSVTLAKDCFYNSAIEVIERPFDFSKVTSSGNGANFNKCPNLREIRFLENTLLVPIHIRQSPLLSAESIRSIFGGLNSEVTGLTLTLSQNAVKKAFETSEGANDGDTSETWNALVASKPNWTITLN